MTLVFPVLRLGQDGSLLRMPSGAILARQPYPFLEAPVSAAAYRARSATELIDATFQLLRRNAAVFFTLSALFTIPNTILQSIFMRPTLSQQPQPLGAGGQSLSGLLVYYLCVLALGSVFQTAMMIAASESYLGKPVIVANDLQQALPKFITIFVAYVLTSILVGVSVLGFIVGSIYVALLFFAVPASIIFENVDLGKAFSRSATLSKGLKGHIFLTLLLAFVIYVVGYLIVVSVASLLAGISPYAKLIIQALGLTFIVPVFPIVAVLIYYDARIRKEGFDIQLMAQAVDSASAGTTKPQPA